MPNFVYDIPTRDLAIYFALIAVGAVFLGILVLKPILRLLMGAPPDLNEAVGYGTAGFSLFYGLLLGLLTVSAYQNNSEVKQAILSEATSLGALYADMSSYPEPIRSDMKAMMRDYLLFTVYRDWPAHRKGEFLNGGANRVNAMRQRLATFEPGSTGEEIVHAQTIAAFQGFAEARQGRLTGVITEIPNVLWYAVLVGAAINLLLLVMLRMRPVMQFFLGSITAFFLAVILFVIVALDDPLRGNSGLGPEPLRLLWDRTMVWDEPI
ncbi:DUF4239 domain-containing protein [Amaricoccus sp.]|uniref:bestrophin-like domain n=1 Tax=Amaricoccus sp. TaxID=1872485 RepID=UPI00261279E3|nr:DUF4239 domain-containing protein [uncultured Amaricoccus sp.]